MARRAIIFSSGTKRENQAQARRARAAVDKRLGYPRDGVNVGGGRHVSPEKGRTLHAVGIREHPDTDAVALEVTDEIEALSTVDEEIEDPETRETRREVLDMTDAEDLDPTWTPPDPAEDVGTR